MIEEGKNNEQDIIEELSELEHEQWRSWSQNIISFCMDDSLSAYDWGEKVSQKHQRWLPMWVDYSELSEELKEHDRIWARKVFEIFKSKLKAQEEFMSGEVDRCVDECLEQQRKEELEFLERQEELDNDQMNVFQMRQERQERIKNLKC